MAQTTLARRKVEADAAIALYGVRAALLTSTTVAIGLETTMADIAADLSAAPHASVVCTTDLDLVAEEVQYHPADAIFAATEGDDAVAVAYYYDGGDEPIVSYYTLPDPVPTGGGVVIRAAEGGIMASRIAAP